MNIFKHFGNHNLTISYKQHFMPWQITEKLYNTIVLIVCLNAVTLEEMQNICTQSQSLPTKIESSIKNIVLDPWLILY